MKRVLVAVLLVAATGSLAYAQGNSGKTKTPPLAPTMIVNANDKVVGPLPDHTAQAYGVTYALVDGHWWAVAVSANGFEMNNDAHASSVLYYENAQCFSQPYMYPSLSNRFSEVVPFLDRDGVFVYSDEPAYTTVTVSAKRSIWPPYSLASPGPCENYCCYSHELNPAKTKLASELGFTPPFRLQ